MGPRGHGGLADLYERVSSGRSSRRGSSDTTTSPSTDIARARSCAAEPSSSASGRARRHPRSDATTACRHRQSNAHALYCHSGNLSRSNDRQGARHLAHQTVIGPPRALPARKLVRSSRARHDLPVDAGAPYDAIDAWRRLLGVDPTRIEAMAALETPASRRGSAGRGHDEKRPRQAYEDRGEDTRVNSRGRGDLGHR